MVVRFGIWDLGFGIDLMDKSGGLKQGTFFFLSTAQAGSFDLALGRVKLSQDKQFNKLIKSGLRK